MSPGSRLPSEEQMAKQLGISRPTIRSALSALEQEGLVVRRHGVGTFATTPQTVMDASLQVLNSVADIVRNNGYESSVTDVHITPAVLPQAVCESL
jgi:GntR family transcriptional regulator